MPLKIPPEMVPLANEVAEAINLIYRSKKIPKDQKLAACKYYGEMLICLLERLQEKERE